MPDDRYQAQLPIERFFRPRAPRRFFRLLVHLADRILHHLDHLQGHLDNKDHHRGHLPHLFPLKEMEVYPSLRLILAQYDHACSGSYIYGLKMADNSGHGLCSQVHAQQQDGAGMALIGCISELIWKISAALCVSNFGI